MFDTPLIVDGMRLVRALSEPPGTTCAMLSDRHRMCVNGIPPGSAGTGMRFVVPCFSFRLSYFLCFRTGAGTCRERVVHFSAGT